MSAVLGTNSVPIYTHILKDFVIGVCVPHFLFLLTPQVYVSKEGTVADYGLVAKEDVEEGEVLFSVPRSALLSQHTTVIRDLLKKGTLTRLGTGHLPMGLVSMYCLVPH